MCGTRKHVQQIGAPGVDRVRIAHGHVVHRTELRTIAQRRDEFKHVATLIGGHFARFESINHCAHRGVTLAGADRVNESFDVAIEHGLALLQLSEPDRFQGTRGQPEGEIDVGVDSLINRAHRHIRRLGSAHLAQGIDGLKANARVFIGNRFFQQWHMIGHVVAPG